MEAAEDTDTVAAGVVALAAAWCGARIEADAAPVAPGLAVHRDRDGRAVVRPAADSAPQVDGDPGPATLTGARECKALVALLRAGWDGTSHLRDVGWVDLADILSAHGATTALAAAHPKGGLLRLAELGLAQVELDDAGVPRRARPDVGLWAEHPPGPAAGRLAEAAGIDTDADRSAGAADER